MTHLEYETLKAVLTKMQSLGVPACAIDFLCRMRANDRGETDQLIDSMLCGAAWPECEGGKACAIVPGAPTPQGGCGAMPGIPGVPAVPGVPGVPSIPGVPAVPAVPTDPNASKAKELLCGTAGQIIQKVLSVTMPSLASALVAFCTGKMPWEQVKDQVCALVANPIAMKAITTLDPSAGLMLSNLSGLCGGDGPVKGKLSDTASTIANSNPSTETNTLLLDDPGIQKYIGGMLPGMTDDPQKNLEILSVLGAAATDQVDKIKNAYGLTDDEADQLDSPSGMTSFLNNLGYNASDDT
jgi:hypothetical protein